VGRYLGKINVGNRSGRVHGDFGILGVRVVRAGDLLVELVVQLSLGHGDLDELLRVGGA